MWKPNVQGKIRYLTLTTHKCGVCLIDILNMVFTKCHFLALGDFHPWPHLSSTPHPPLSPGCSQRRWRRAHHQSSLGHYLTCPSLSNFPTSPTWMLPHPIALALPLCHPLQHLTPHPSGRTWTDGVPQSSSSSIQDWCCCWSLRSMDTQMVGADAWPRC